MFWSYNGRKVGHFALDELPIYQEYAHGWAVSRAGHRCILIPWCPCRLKPWILTFGKHIFFEQNLRHFSLCVRRQWRAILCKELGSIDRLQTRQTSKTDWRLPEKRSNSELPPLLLHSAICLLSMQLHLSCFKANNKSFLLCKIDSSSYSELLCFSGSHQSVS